MPVFSDKEEIIITKIKIKKMRIKGNQCKINRLINPDSGLHYEVRLAYQ